MRRYIAPLLLLPLVAACAGPRDGAVPSRVRLSPAELTVGFSDGTSCRAPVPAGGGQGRMPDCPHVLDYDVKVLGPNLLGGLPVVNAFVQPRADIVLTVPGLVPRRFYTPGSRDYGPERDSQV